MFISNRVVILLYFRVALSEKLRKKHTNRKPYSEKHLMLKVVHDAKFKDIEQKQLMIA